MSVTVVVGAQWGDEGKGKIVDLLAADGDGRALPGRQQRRPHARHRGKKIVLHLIPSGILRDDALCLHRQRRRAEPGGAREGDARGRGAKCGPR